MDGDKRPSGQFSDVRPARIRPPDCERLPEIAKFQPPADARPHYHGHRARLRRRFLEGGADALPDYELLEVILFAGNPRIDMKPVAKALIARFGSLQRVLSAPPADLAKAGVRGLAEAGIVAIKAAQAAGIRLLAAEARARPVIGSWRAVLDYCRAQMAHERVEQFRILFLDRKNRLIADEVHQRGTVDHTPVYPREVLKRALDVDATALILVHNHPSGDPTPSRPDVEMTKAIGAALDTVEIALHDHVIIAGDSHSSFRGLGLL